MTREDPAGPANGGYEQVDYDWTYTLATSSRPSGSAEDLLRRVWEEGPRFLAWFLPIAWKLGLGLRLGPKGSTSHVLGWPVVSTRPNEVEVATTSPIMAASNTITIADTSVQWSTRVTYANALGRLMWLPARVVHQLLVPFTLRRAQRNRYRD